MNLNPHMTFDLEIETRRVSEIREQLIFCNIASKEKKFQQ